MTQSRFFQYSLLFPVLMWALGMLGYSLFFLRDYSIIMKILLDALRVFVPYSFFAAAIWKLARNRPYRALKFMAFVIPIAWGVFFTLCYMPYSYFKERLLDGHILCIMGFWATVVAYFAELMPYFVLVSFKDHFRDSPARGAGSAASMHHSPVSPEG